MKTYDELKAAMKTELEDSTVESWFAFLDRNGWTGEQFRLAAAERRASKGLAAMPPCSGCGKDHDTLAIAYECPTA